MLRENAEAKADRRRDELILNRPDMLAAIQEDRQLQAQRDMEFCKLMLQADTNYEIVPSILPPYETKPQ